VNTHVILQEQLEKPKLDSKLPDMKSLIITLSAKSIQALDAIGCILNQSY